MLLNLLVPFHNKHSQKNFGSDSKRRTFQAQVIEATTIIPFLETVVLFSPKITKISEKIVPYRNEHFRFKLIEASKKQLGSQTETIQKLQKELKP